MSYLPSSNRGSGAVSRREALWHLGGGLGGIALTHLLGQSSAFAESAASEPSLNGGLHHPAKAKRVVQLFMNGGVSQMDTFDYKPELEKRHGEAIDFGIKAAATSVPGAVMKSPFGWKQHGESGRWVSDVFPEMAGLVDDLAFLMAMSSKTNVHGPASYLQNTGFLLPGFPCMGAWISYGLGSLSDNLPSFVVLPDPRGLPYNNAGNFTSGFLPMTHQGKVIRPSNPTPIHDLAPPEFATEITPRAKQRGSSCSIESIETISKSIRAIRGLKPELHPMNSQRRCSSRRPRRSICRRSRNRRMRRMASTRQETADFGRNCLTARRLLERGVRFVQVWSGAGGAER